MRVAVTGTPGTGKTTATEELDTDVPVIHLNDVVREENLVERRDEERDTDVVDVDAIAEWIQDNTPENAIVESHLAHHFDADRVVVLRAHPEEIERRLEVRGEPEAKIIENAESEALDLVLTEAVNRNGEDSVYEIDTTDCTPEAVAAEIEAILRDEREPSAGTVSFVEYLDQ